MYRRLIGFLWLFLGRSGVYHASSDLTVAYLSGVEQSTSGEGNTKRNDSPFFTASDVNDMIQTITSKANFQGVDLLLTSQWPQNVEKYGIPVVCMQSFFQLHLLISSLIFVCMFDLFLVAKDDGRSKFSYSILHYR
jgi:hypothetical protein